MNRKEVKIYIESSFVEAIEWTFNVYATYSSVRISFVVDKELADFICSSSKDADVFINESFWKRMLVKDFSYEKSISSNFQVEVNGKIDVLGTAFYFLNCLWERSDDFSKDKWGRSSFSSSIWKEFGFKEPFLHVNDMFDDLTKQIKVTAVDKKSSVFLSHDIDAVYSAWKEDGKNALVNLKIFSFARILFLHLINKPTWFNFEKIVNIERKYNAKSTFYWLVNKDVIKGIGRNADYKLSSLKMQNVFLKLKKLGASIGIHKSISPTTLNEEIIQFPADIKSNRYHYLKFQFEELVKEMNQSSLRMDASLGYADCFGYRNGFSLPFSPFDFNNNCSSNFIEVPLVIMDGTFSRYLNVKGEDAERMIKNFISAHDKNAVISILWHNSHFTNFKYKGYPQVYEGVLKYLQDEKIETLSDNELIQKFS